MPKKVFAPLAGGLADLRVEGDNLFVKTGDLKVIANYTLKLFVERKRLLKSDVVLINRILKTQEFIYQPLAGRALPEGSVINGRGLPNLHQQAETTIF